ncbi:MAG: tRNA (adenosine(37)-N6)-threonylcarbamoyltransferase complex dimerization subunit type 1 TsaB [Endomicrobiaceae bacterium]|nr:tRNA (adenosine(37)-N6)-threonylcarbamoyltransferase complex dimerization subunit type 1 TsaB [Endomicrobiaceae bacterium]
MKILAIESSGASLSVSISENSNIVAEYFYNAGKIHSEILISLIEKIVKDVNWDIKDIDKFAVSSGPGSFTGIRVAMTTVKTLSQTLNKPVVSIDTLSILESNINIKDIKIVAAIDALREELYIKQNNKVIIVTIKDFIKKYKKYKNNILVIGNAVEVHKKVLSKELGKTSVNLMPNLHFPKASTLAFIASDKEGVSFKEVEPLYVRKSWAEEKPKS